MGKSENASLRKQHFWRMMRYFPDEEEKSIVPTRGNILCKDSEIENVSYAWVTERRPGDWRMTNGQKEIESSGWGEETNGVKIT